MKRIAGLFVFMLIAASSAQAAFVNSGFESGSFTGWTRNGGLYLGSGVEVPSGYYGQSGYIYQGDPAKSAIVTSGTDPISGLPRVYSGTYAARINNSDNQWHFSTITQSITWSDPQIYILWNAVLQEPYHDHINEPNFSISLYDNTTQTSLYDYSFASDTIPAALLNTTSYGGSTWKYTPWVYTKLDTSAVVGHNLTLTVLASDCGRGGHGGYAYVDSIEPYLVDPNNGVTPALPLDKPTVPIPGAVWLLGSGLAGLLGLRRRIKS